uniref:Uncharacterized protein n=1 Tax=Oryza rufipogon TaxID=4529 RepID=A0A0E0QS89_ORYRU
MVQNSGLRKTCFSVSPCTDNTIILPPQHTNLAMLPPASACPWLPAYKKKEYSFPVSVMHLAKKVGGQILWQESSHKLLGRLDCSSNERIWKVRMRHPRGQAVTMKIMPSD